MAYRQGRKNRIRIVAEARPKVRLITSGCKIWACRLFSKSRGSIPARVVAVVMKIGRNLLRDASRAALEGLISSRVCLVINCTNRIELFTSTPESATSPIKLGRDISNPSRR